MEPTGSNKDVLRRAEERLLEVRLVNWKKTLFGAFVASATLTVVIILNIAVYYTGDAPVEAYKAFAYPIVLLGVLCMIAALSIAWHVDTLEKRLARSRKA